MDDKTLIENLIDAHELAEISVLEIILKKENEKYENLKTLIQCYDIIIKYAKNLQNVYYYNLLVNIINQFIIQYSKFTGSNVYREGNYDNIISKMIIPYQHNFNPDENEYIKNIISAVSLIKQSLNSIFEMGDDLIYGYERMLCFEINDKNDNDIFITNKLNKDCIFKEARASNEAIYKLVKYYYDIFIINCIDDLELSNQLTTTEFVRNYYNILYKDDTMIQSVVLPTIKLYNELNFQEINYIFNIINKSHPDKYINEAAKLIKRMGLCMLDYSLFEEDLMTNENRDYDYFSDTPLVEIEMPPFESRVIDIMNRNYLYWGDRVVDEEYSGYFEYQYYSLLYYMEDLGEDVKREDKLDKIIINIREQAKNLIFHYDYYGNNYIIVNEIIYKYERMVDILAEYVYQYGYENLRTDDIKKYYLPDDQFENYYIGLLNVYNELDEIYEKIANNSLIKEFIKLHNNIMLESVDDIYNFSNKVLSITDSNENINNVHGFGSTVLMNKINNAINKYWKEGSKLKETMTLVGGHVVDYLASVVYGNIDKYNVDNSVFTSSYTLGYSPSIITEELVIKNLPYIQGKEYGNGQGKKKDESNINQESQNDLYSSIFDIISDDEDSDFESNIANSCVISVSHKRSIKYKKFVKRETNCNKKNIIRDYNYNKEIGKNMLKESTNGITPMSVDDIRTINKILEINRSLSKGFLSAESVSSTSDFGENSESITSSKEIDSKMDKENSRFNTNLYVAEKQKLISKDTSNRNKRLRRRKRIAKKRNSKNNNRKNANSVKDLSDKK